jgi:hypothetical protein
MRGFENFVWSITTVYNGVFLGTQLCEFVSNTLQTVFTIRWCNKQHSDTVCLLQRNALAAVFCPNVVHWILNTTSHTPSPKKTSLHNLQKPSSPLCKMKRIIPWQLAQTAHFSKLHLYNMHPTIRLSASIFHPSHISKTHTWANTLANDIPVSTTGHNINFLLDQNILQLLTHFAHFAHCFHVNKMVIAPPCRVTVSNLTLVQSSSEIPNATNATLPVVQSTHYHYSEWAIPAHSRLTW